MEALVASVQTQIFAWDATDVFLWQLSTPEWNLNLVIRKVVKQRLVSQKKAEHTEFKGDDMKKTFKIFGFLNRLSLIIRWSLMYNTKSENVAEHSWNVSAIAHALAVIRNRFFDGNLDVAKVVLHAVYHDASETLTGDTPTPLKYFSPEVKAALDSIEALAINKMVNCLPEEMKDDYRQVFNIPAEFKPLIKAADRIAALAKCIEERRRGNDEFIPAEKRLSDELESTKESLPEVGYFMDNFLPGFNLPLDALCSGNGSWILDAEDTKYTN